ncbi:uncharacterized protein [Clytia hemisphaerica]|uniref:uncharacterized protein isoform X2 n=1 Tax=Clytia hemisphaerica TaxID=252671 RepID=UPI0034D7B9FD
MKISFSFLLVITIKIVPIQGSHNSIVRHNRMAIGRSAKTFDPTEEKVLTVGIKLHSTMLDVDHEYSLYVSTMQDPALNDWPRPDLQLMEVVKLEEQDITLSEEPQIEYGTNRYYRATAKIGNKILINAVDDTDSQKKLLFDVKIKMTDSPNTGSRYLTTVHQLMKPNLKESRRIWMRQTALFKSTTPQSIDQLNLNVDFQSGLKMPGTFVLIKFNYQYRKGKKQATDVVGEFWIPPTLDAETCYCSSPNSFLPGSWDIDIEKRKIILKIDYIDPNMGDRYFQFRCRVNVKIFTNYLAERVKIRAYQQWTLCKYDSCNDSTRKRSVRGNKIVEANVVTEEKILNPEPFRIMNPITGQCWWYNISDKLMRQSTEGCKAFNFHHDMESGLLYSHQGYPIISNDKDPRQIKIDATKTNSDGTYIFSRDTTYNLMRIVRVELGGVPLKAYPVVGLNSDGVLLIGDGWGDDLETVKEFTNRHEDDHFIKLPAWPGMENMILKGVLVVNTEYGHTMVVCNLKRNLITRPNCFWGIGQGEKWTAFSSMVTYIEFFAAWTNYFYGKCNHDQWFCKIHTNHLVNQHRNRYEVVEESEYVHEKPGPLSTFKMKSFDDMNITSPVAIGDDGVFTVTGASIYKSGDRILNFNGNL